MIEVVLAWSAFILTSPSPVSGNRAGPYNRTNRRTHYCGGGNSGLKLQGGHQGARPGRSVSPALAQGAIVIRPGTKLGFFNQNVTTGKRGSEKAYLATSARQLSPNGTITSHRLVAEAITMGLWP